MTGIPMAGTHLHSALRILAVLLVTACAAPAHPASAQADDISQLIQLVNELRASNGLAPYMVDYGLMALAQEHSEYQAAIHTSTHEHSDGRVPPEIGVVENVAGGDLDYIDPYTAVYEIWADQVHRRAMIGYPAGWIGVGIADDGTTAYYTLEVRPAGASTPKPGDPDSGSMPTPWTPAPFATLVAATPLPDGSIVHIVRAGETLWTIAVTYGITIDQIRAWNNMAADSTDIYVGQKLLVRPAGLVTMTPALATEARAQETEAVFASTPVHDAMASITPSPPGSTPTVPDPAALRPTGLETGQGIQASGEDSQAAPGLLIPLLAGGSILIGCALLLLVGFNRKRV